MSHQQGAVGSWRRGALAPYSATEHGTPKKLLLKPCPLQHDNLGMLYLRRINACITRLPHRSARLWDGGVHCEATPQELGWTSVPWVRELGWFCGEFGRKAVTKDQLGRDSWAWDN